MPKVVDVAVVMPVYNERDCLHEVIDEWVNTFKGMPGHAVLVLCDDGSTDNSRQICEEWVAREPERVILRTHPNIGHGPTVYWGYRYAIFDLAALYVGQADSDGQFPAAEFAHLWTAIRGVTAAKLIVGSRRTRHDPQLRIRLSHGLRWLNARLFGEWVEDANCPLRIMEAGYLRRVLQTIPATMFAPNVALALRGARDGVLLHMPIRHLPRRTGTVTINRRLLAVCWRNLTEMVRYRFSGFARGLDDRSQRVAHR